MAAAESGRDVAYFTFGEADLMRDVSDLHTYLTDRAITVGKGPLILLILADLHHVKETLICTADIWF